MLNNNFTVKYVTSRNCFLMLSETNLKKLSSQKLVKLCFENEELYCSCLSSSSIGDNNVVGIPSVYAKALGISEHQTVYITDVLHLSVLNKIVVSPVSNDDYEILQTSTQIVQSTLLDQIQVVNRGQKLTIWISKWLRVTVQITETEPIPFGCLANLTEVHITQTPIKKSIKTPKPETNSPPEIPKLDPKLMKLKNYYRTTLPVIFRVCPLIFETENDSILNHPYNIFIHKSNHLLELESESESESNQFTLMKMIRIEAPVDLRETKSNEIKNELIINLCLVEHFYNTFSDTVKNYFDSNRECFNAKYPRVFVPVGTMNHFDLKPGSKVLIDIQNEFDSLIDVRNLELFVGRNGNKKKEINAVEKFKIFVAERVKKSKLILNSDITFELETNLLVSIKFNPNSNYFVFDESKLREIKITENHEKPILNSNQIQIQNKNDSVKSNDLCTEICDFTNILNQSLKLLTLKESNENILIVGKSGTGKTVLRKVIAEKLIAQSYYQHVIELNCKQLKGKSVETLHKLFVNEFRNLVYYQPAVLVLDDLHVICGRSETGTEVQTQEFIYFNRVASLLAELLETYQVTNKISIIGTSESTFHINEHILSSRGKHYFRNVFNIPELNKKQRYVCLQHLFKKYATINPDIDFNDLSIKTEGYVIQDLVDLINKTVFESLKRNVSQLQPVITESDLNTALINSVPLALRNVQLHSPGIKDFRDIGGLEQVKKILIESLNWPAQYPEIFNNSPLRLQSGILLYGPPGVGKTVLVGATARECDLRLIAVKGPELLSKYIGASEQSVRNIFEKAQSARPCILFFDEFDSLAPRRGHDSTGVTDRVVNQLLTQLDGVESLTGVFVIAATSRPDLLDPALLRPGRLDRQIFCPVPDQVSRLAILEALSRNLKLNPDIDFKSVAANTKGFSGADLQGVLYTAQLYAVEEALQSNHNVDEGVIVTREHIDDALKGAGPSVNKQEASKYEKIYAKFQSKGEGIDQSIRQQKATLA